MSLIPALLKDKDLLNEVDQYLPDKENFHVWWLGQSGYLLVWNGKQLLLDPYLSDSLTKKYASTGKPHVRMSERVIDPELLTNISIVTSSHNHTDHLDGETLIPILKNNPAIHMLIPEANRSFVAERIQRYSEFPTGITEQKEIVIEGFTFHGIPASHNTIERDDHGNCKFMGYVIEFGKWRVYHSGDTLLYDGMVELLKPFHVDVAFLPINGDDPARGVAGNLSAIEAAELGKQIEATVVIPGHYDMFAFNTADPNEFVKAAVKIGQPFAMLQPGERWDSSAQ